MNGFDSLVDLLMAAEGYDRDEAELVARDRLDKLAADIHRACDCDECDCDPGDCACGCVA